MSRDARADLSDPDPTASAPATGSASWEAELAVGAERFVPPLHWQAVQRAFVSFKFFSPLTIALKEKCNR